MLHFAYGSNMHRAIMRKHAPEAQPLGVAELADHRFLITADGYASVVPARAQVVHGVLWRITQRDRAALDAWENIAADLYRAEMRPVRHAGRLHQVLVYVAGGSRVGRPKAGYMEIVIAAARHWRLPQDYIAGLEPWLPVGPVGAGTRKLADVSWT
jgi:hypothetical protein